jgi:hypothetical protein
MLIYTGSKFSIINFHILESLNCKHVSILLVENALYGADGSVLKTLGRVTLPIHFKNGLSFNEDYGFGQ